MTRSINGRKASPIVSPLIALGEGLLYLGEGLRGGHHEVSVEGTRNSQHGGFEGSGQHRRLHHQLQGRRMATHNTALRVWGVQSMGGAMKYNHHYEFLSSKRGDEWLPRERQEKRPKVMTGPDKLNVLTWFLDSHECTRLSSLR